MLKNDWIVSALRVIQKSSYITNAVFFFHITCGHHYTDFTYQCVLPNHGDKVYTIYFCVYTCICLAVWHVYGEQVCCWVYVQSCNGWVLHTKKFVSMSVSKVSHLCLNMTSFHSLQAVWVDQSCRPQPGDTYSIFVGCAVLLLDEHEGTCIIPECTTFRVTVN